MTNISDEIRRESQTFVRNNKNLIIDKDEKGAFSYISPRISSEFMDCSMPMTFDNYSHCHPAGTKVRMATGYDKPIEEININEKILSFSIETSSIEESKVIHCFKRSSEKIITIETEDGDCLRLTGDHPVFVDGKGWIKANELTTKDFIYKIEI